MLFRSAHIAIRLLPTVVSLLRDRKRWILFGAPRVASQQKHAARAVRLRKHVVRLGPTFIKLSQILSTRADLLPAPYIQELSKLQDRVPPHPARVIKKIIATELRRPVEQVFDSFDDEPLAAASLGQVHTARYKGERVAVKVLRPRVRKLVDTDLRIVNRILAILNTCVHHFALSALTTVIDEYEKIIHEEMDFILEAQNAERFRANLAARPQIIIPEIYHELTTSRVLVLKHYDGVKITDAAALKAMGINPLPLLDDLIEVYAQMVLVDGFFHADPHPGNILVLPDRRIVLLDFGMVIHLDEQTKDKLLRTTLAWARRDIDALVSCLYDLEVIEPDVNPATVVDAARELTDILDRYKFSQRRIQQYANAVLATFYKFPIRMPSNLVYLAKTGVTIEGIGIMYDPTYDGAKAATPVIKRMIGSVLKEPAQSPLEFILKKFEQARHFYDDAVRAFRKAAREEMRVRMHPADLAELEKFFSRTTRRTVAAVFTLSVAIVTAILYLSEKSTTLLAVGLGVTFTLFVLLYLRPTSPRK